MASSTMANFGSESGFLLGWEKLKVEKCGAKNSSRGDFDGSRGKLSSKEELKAGFREIFAGKSSGNSKKVARKSPVSAESVLESMRRDIQLTEYKDISGLKTAGGGCDGSIRVKARVGADRRVSGGSLPKNKGEMKLRMEIRTKGPEVAQRKSAKTENTRVVKNRIESEVVKTTRVEKATKVDNPTKTDVKFVALKMTGAAQSVITGSDAVIVDKSRGMLAVFDGGEKSGKGVAKAFSERVKALSYQMRIRNSGDVFALAMQADGDMRNMGVKGCVSSVIAQMMQDKGGLMLYFVAAGGARLYIVRDENAMQITKDETVRGKVVNGFLMNNFSLKQRSGVRLERGDKIVMMTDGVYDGNGEDLADEEVAEVVNFAKSDTAAAKGLVSCGRKNDDRTAVVLSI